MVGNNRSEQRTLKTKGGKYVTVWKGKDGHKLYALDRQVAPPVQIYRRVINQRNQMAFCFKRHDGDYYPKVDGKKLKLDTIATLTENHWFEKINLKVGNHYGLRSVGEPSQYLSLDTSMETRCLICLSEADENCVQVTDEST